MSVFLIIFLLVVFNKLSFCSNGELNYEYMDLKNTKSVNGIFVVLVLFSHYTQYATLDGPYDAPYLALREHLDQLVVAPFWFYSGYGMCTAIINSRGGGEEYVNKIPTKFWQLLLKFDIAVLTYYILYVTLGNVQSLGKLLLALIGWTSVGNSNWYIFAVLVEYILMYGSFKLENMLRRNSYYIGVILFIVFTMIFVLALKIAGRPAYTYNTIIIMPFGALFAECKKNIEKIMKYEFIYISTLAVTIGAYIFAFLKRWSYGILGYSIWTIMFVTVLILVTMKIEIHNPLIEWFGNHVFSIYILQRLPMIALTHFGIVNHHKYISLIIVLITTVMISYIYEITTRKIIEKIVSK